MGIVARHPSGISLAELTKTIFGNSATSWEKSYINGDARLLAKNGLLSMCNTPDGTAFGCASVRPAKVPAQPADR